MKKVSLFPKKYWLKKYNDGINFKIKMVEKASTFPSKKKRKLGGKEINRMKVKMKLVNMLRSKFFWGESENDKK